MYNKNSKRTTKAGARKTQEPRLVGDVLSDYLQNSNSPLAAAYRQRLHPDTHPCIDLKVLTREPGHMDIGDYLGGVITRDGEERFVFIENGAERQRVPVMRNPHVYQGTRINVNRGADGTLYPTFTHPRYTAHFSFREFCLEAAEELIAVAGLIEKEGLK